MNKCYFHFKKYRISRFECQKNNRAKISGFRFQGSGFKVSGVRFQVSGFSVHLFHSSFDVGRSMLDVHPFIRSKVQRFRGSGVHRFKGSGFKVSGVRVQGSSSFDIRNSLFDILRFIGSRVQRFRGSRFQSFK
jgi:hypothetical protein